MSAGEAAPGREVALMRVEVGRYRVVFDLRTLLSVEGQSRVEHDAILGPIDLRVWLGEKASGEGESLLVLGKYAVYRLLVDRVRELVHGEVRRVHPIPSLLRPLAERTSLRGVVELADGLGFLLDPRALALAAGYEG
ncbi:MAG: hypothetical protein D6731_11330 [Planctomycetota bacterium]|nr:MAG: hypothetical protein D6731_11330 [Planctomycetota bacterium]